MPWLHSGNIAPHGDTGVPRLSIQGYLADTSLISLRCRRHGGRATRAVDSRASRAHRGGTHSYDPPGVSSSVARVWAGGVTCSVRGGPRRSGFFFLFLTLVTVPRRSLSLLGDMADARPALWTAARQGRVEEVRP